MDFFYSDPHFGHQQALESCGRPFKDTDEMDAELIRRYNAIVGKNDTVAWMGDCFFCPRSRAREILAELNGIKALFEGNHDDKPQRMKALGFDMVFYRASTLIGGTPVQLCHFPYLPPWHERLWKRLRGDLLGSPDDLRHRQHRPPRKPGWLIHGHVHNAWKVKGRQINVGVDQWAFAPVSRQEIVQIMQKKEGRDGL